MKQEAKLPTRLEEGKHFYIEHGNYVFTAYYLELRGYCCGSKCRHCPYEHENVSRDN